jgi:hypothetical protein
LYARRPKEGRDCRALPRGGGEATSTAVAGHQPLYTRPPTNNLCMSIGPRRGGIAEPRTRGAGEATSTAVVC